MDLQPINLEHGEIYGSLTVLAKVKSYSGWQYRCGCACGNSSVFARAKHLMSGKVKSCYRCKSGATLGTTTNGI